MKAKILAAALLLAATPALATTYTYESGLYSYNANAHPELFGDRLTGSVTFREDTTHYTGRLFFPLALSLTSGVYTATSFSSATSLTFVDGAIIDWGFGTVIPCGFNTFPCVIETYASVLPHAGIYHQCHQCAVDGLQEAATTRDPGGWTMVAPAQVPGPVVGAGLPALMMLIALWQRWRRCARSC